jgi:hypothetical protein
VEQKLAFSITKTAKNWIETKLIANVLEKIYEIFTERNNTPILHDFLCIKDFYMIKPKWNNKNYSAKLLYKTTLKIGDYSSLEQQRIALFMSEATLEVLRRSESILFSILLEGYINLYFNGKDTSQN